MRGQRTSMGIGVGPWLILLSAGLGYWLLSDQALEFPLGAEDQHRVAAALGAPWDHPSDSWIADWLDPLAARVSPPAAYVYLQFLRRAAMVAAWVGMGVWAWRAGGWVQGVWIVGLAVGFLPMRLAGATLAPQALALPFLVWGWSLTLGPPWSKTGALESTAGGVLLGLSLFAAPWAWLFGLSVPAAALFSGGLRRRLAAGFWFGLGAGAVPCLIWWLWDPTDQGRDLGFHPETLVRAKIPQVQELVLSVWGASFTFLVVVGVWAVFRYRQEWNRWALLLAWGVVPTVLLGYAAPAWSALAAPGLVLLAAAGLSGMGRIFVHRVEREFIPSLGVLFLAHHLFFSGMPMIRGQQAFAREERAVAHLLAEHVGDGEYAALFRLNRLVVFTETVHPGRDWEVLEAEFFLQGTVEQTLDQTAQFLAIEGQFWVDPKRLGELGERGAALLEGIEARFGVERRVGRHSAELWRVSLR